MSLFQKSVLNKHLKAQDQDKIKAAYQKFTDYFHNPARQENIRNAKEEQFQEGFLRELFVKVLGYTLNPEPDYNLTTEFKNEKGAKKADGAILKEGKAIAVIELKGSDTKDLDKVNDQAFGYKNNQSNCVYVVTSNFEKLRFFIDNAVEHIEFNLFNLSYDDFAVLWLCLHLDNVLAGIPLKTKEDSVLVEENITKKLYKDYSTFKRELWQNICKNSPDIDQLLLFKKSQKLLDRFLFVFFAEDSGLLPPNSITRMVERYEKLIELDAAKPLYEIFKQYFGYINEGRKGKSPQDDIFAYNGGLFLPDEVLDSIQIDDDLLKKHVLTMTAYDFQSEVDVNILGHIFENSLNEIENVTAQLQGLEVDKSKTKRKKDGVFYTPKYITKYIVDNTVGALCVAKKAELGVIDEEYAKSRKGRKKTIIKKLDTALKQYRDWLLNITICDPACGSGAFLNQALEFLINEHAYIDELNAQLFGSSIIFQDVSNHVLENNIFGVDINEESVEIAKLSLWLRTAQKGRKLTSLNNNIKCGNSLIDDPTIAGEKAFNWQNEFPEVFKNGGFDVVVGNPPYVHLEKIKDESEKLSKLDYETFDKRGDLYPLFVEQGMNILKDKGLESYIMPNKWLQAGYGKNLRAYFLTKQLKQLIDFGDLQIFEGATTYPCIFIAKNDKPTDSFSVSVLKATSLFNFDTLVSNTAETFKTNEFNSDTWVISSKTEKTLLEKLSNNFRTLEDSLQNGSFRGILTGLTEAFLINQKTISEILQNDKEISNVIHPFLQGRDVKPYVVPVATSYLILFPKGYTKEVLGECTEEQGWDWLQKTFPLIAKWLLPFQERGRKRTDKGDFWWEVRACDYYEEFQKPKIMYQKFQVKPCFVYDEQNLYCNDSMWIIPTNNKALVAVLNSKMGWWLITKYCTQIQNGCQLIWKYFGKIPVPKLSSQKLEEYASLMLAKTKELENISGKFKKHITSIFQLDKLSKKLQSWYELDFKAFLSELEKARKKVAKENGQDYKKLSLPDQSEWMEYFNEQKEKAQALQAEINQTDKEIDAMVYELYGLTDEEIKIVEGGV